MHIFGGFKLVGPVRSFFTSFHCLFYTTIKDVLDHDSDHDQPWYFDKFDRPQLRSDQNRREFYGRFKHIYNFTIVQLITKLSLILELFLFYIRRILTV